MGRGRGQRFKQKGRIGHGTDVPGEVPTEEKLARLKRYKRDNGTLEGINGPQPLDVRSLRSMETAPRSATKPEKSAL